MSAEASGEPQLRIVPFTDELAPHFHRINEHWVSKYFRLEEIDRKILSNPEEHILRPGGAVLFALLGDAVVGTCALKPDGPGCYELSKMGVEEGHQGRGIGRRLLEAAIAEFQRREGSMLFLETNSILRPAITLYESAGFERQPERRPGSAYDRSDVYMIWRAAKARRQPLI